MTSPGKKFRQAIASNNPLMVVGAINAYCAKMAETIGHKALYLSGAGVANASFGIPSFSHVSVIQTVSISCISASISNSFILLKRDLAFTNITLGKNLFLLMFVVFSKGMLIKLCALTRGWEAILETDLKEVQLT